MQSERSMDGTTVSTSYELLHGPTELPAEFAERVLAQVERGEPLDPSGRMTDVVAKLATDDTVDPHKVVARLADCSPEIGRLLGADVGLDEGYRLHEHTQANLGGFEADYASRFADPQDKKLMRTLLILQDIGKSLCIGMGEHRYGQTTYNALVAQNLLSTVDPRVLDDDEKSLVALLVNQDILGSAAKMVTWSKPDESCMSLDDATSRMVTLRDSCPPVMLPKLRDFLPAAYLADVTAYTAHRSYVRAETGELTVCVGVLDGLFERDEADALQFKNPAVHEVIDYLVSLA